MGVAIEEPGTLRVAGALRDHPRAAAFAEQVRRVHHRYATEIVGAFSLCPHMRDPDRAFGRFCVMLDREPDLDAARDEAIAAGGRVAHLVYPLVTMEVSPFERFGNDLHRAVAARVADSPVHATFHPRMPGDASSAQRLVGLLRRAPDPFVQFVPEGLQQGGTSYVDLDQIDLADLAVPQKKVETTFERLTEDDIAAIERTVDDISADRDARYAPFLEALR